MGEQLSEANRAIFLKAKVGITDVLPAFRHFANPLGVLNQIMDLCRAEGPTNTAGETRDLTVDQIDEAITALIVSGPGGVAAGVNLGRVAGRALKMLHNVVGPQAALVTAEALVANIKAGKIQ